MIALTKGSLFAHINRYLTVYLPTHRKVSPNTIRAYTATLNLLVDFVKNQKKVPLQDVTFSMLTAETVLSFLDNLETERRCGISTRNSRLAAIRAFVTYVASMDITAVVVLEELKKVPTKKQSRVEVIDYMTMNAVSAIAAVPDSHVPRGLRDRFFIILMYDLGARCQEMIDIELCDLRFGERTTITLHGKGGKDRTVPIMDSTAAYLKQYLNVYHKDEYTGSSRPLFYSETHGKIHTITDRRIRYMLKDYGAIARESCVEVPENVHPHLFRHSRAMHLYQGGMDLTLVSQWLGHSQLESTRIYAHADTEHKRKAIAAATPPDSPLGRKLSPERFIISDEDMLKRLAGLK
jgi:site-specific recombinase XerD